MKYKLLKDLYDCFYTDRTRELTMQTAETKRIGCPSGRLTIRNTMIKIGGARYVKVHF